jgi:hypothetical protein
MFVTHDFIPDMEIIAMSGWGNVDAITIPFPYLIEMSTQYLLLA